MKSVIILFVLLFNYSYCEELLGRWSVSKDHTLIHDSLKKALFHIRGTRVRDDVLSQVSNIACRTQIVNGLNIKLSFVFREQKWECSLYKSFIQTLDTQVEQCNQVGDEKLSKANDDDDDDDQVDQQLPQPNGDQKEGQAAEEVLNPNEDNDDGEAQAAKELPPLNEDNDDGEAQAAKKLPQSNEDKDDGEAQIDAINQQAPEENVNGDDDDDDHRP